MKHLIFTIFILSSIVFTSCDKFINGLIVDINPPEHESVLVPYCFLNAKDTIMEVYVQQSQGILDSIDDRFIKNATVQILKNGTLLKEVTNYVPDLHSGYFYRIELDQPMSETDNGDTYELRVSAPGFETVTATQTVPKPKNAVSAQFFENGGSNYGEIIDNVRVTIDDTPNEENYYQIILDVMSIGTIASGDTVRQSRSVGGQTLANTESMSNALDGVVLTDKLFDGQRFTADVGTTFSGSSSTGTNEEITYTGTIKLRLLSISRDEYLYQKSLYSYSNAVNNPFAEPTLLYSNTSSGLGMFSIIAETVEDFAF